MLSRKEHAQVGSLKLVSRLLGIEESLELTSFKQLPKNHFFFYKDDKKPCNCTAIIVYRMSQSKSHINRYFPLKSKVLSYE